MADNFWEKPLATLNAEEWDQLCDGCGLCCLYKVENADTADVYLTKVACRLLDVNTCQCKHYVTRHEHVSDCVKLTYEQLSTINWLPTTCAYYLRYHDKALPEWHYLISGDRQLVHTYKISLRRRFISEDYYDAKVHTLKDFMVKHPSFKTPPYY